MKFTNEELLEIAESPKQADEITKGRKYESRLRLFTEPKFEDEIKNESSWKEYLKYIHETIEKKKAEKIIKFFQYPLVTTGLTEDILNGIYKVFNAGNAYFNVETVQKQGGEKLNEILSDLNVLNWIEEKGKECLSSKPNLVVVVDKDEESKPYLLAVDNDRLLDIKLRPDGVRCEYITFTHSIIENEDGNTEIRIAVYDDENYNVILNVEGNYTLEKSVRHGAEVCPARMFLKKKLNSDSDLNRRAPLSVVLSKLKEYQLFHDYRLYADHYVPFPVTEMQRASCKNEMCDNGWITTTIPDLSGGENKEQTKTTKCQECESLNNVAVGAKILLDPVDDDQKSAAGIFKMISHDTEGLQYLDSKLNGIEKYVKLRVLGKSEIITKEAINEKQVQGGVDSEENVLLNIKTNLDELYTWIVDTVNVVYSNSKINIQASFGDEWYLISEDDLLQRYKVAKENNMPKEEINLIYFQIIETKYRGNPDKVEKLKIMNRLDPAPHLDFEQKVLKLDRGVFSDEEFIMSERLITFVNRFESENGPLIEFGAEMEPAKKLQKIEEIFNKYTNERIKDYHAKLDKSGKEADGED